MVIIIGIYYSLLLLHNNNILILMKIVRSTVRVLVLGSV
jgi:hypothetical protein